MKTLVFTTNDEKSVKALSEYLNYLNTDKHKDKQVEYIIDIKKNKPIRSISANRYYRAILLEIASASGYTDDEIHEFYKRKFHGKYVLDEVIGQSTSNMDTAEFSNYVKKVKQHGEEFFGVIIKDPKDKDYLLWEQLSKNKYDQMFNAI